MRKKILLRGAIGFPIGITIGYGITILVSLAFADGYYSPCVPELVTAMGNEINAVIVQALLCGLLGVGFGASSVIWELDHWSLVKQSGIYFLIASVIMMPVAWLNYWMEHSTKGFLSYFGIFTFIFIVIWGTEFFTGKRNVRKMNEKLQNKKH